jgi:flagellar biosynthesis GTPase FlhF
VLRVITLPTLLTAVTGTQTVTDPNIGFLKLSSFAASLVKSTSIWVICHVPMSACVPSTSPRVYASTVITCFPFKLPTFKFKTPSINYSKDYLSFLSTHGKKETKSHVHFLKIWQYISSEEEEAREKWLEEHAEEIEKDDKTHEEFLRKEEEYLAKHPEERKKREEKEREQDEAYLQYLKDNAEEIEQQEKWLEEESIRLDERRKTLKELQDIIKKAKEAKNGDCQK